MPRSMLRTSALVLLIFPWVMFAAAKPSPTLPPLDPARIAELTTIDTGHPVHFSPPFSDRAFWHLDRWTDSTRVPSATAQAATALLSNGGRMRRATRPRTDRGTLQPVSTHWPADRF
ncbi:hypothetical protein [Geminisphaera colitermitum]|uniref:hypothetical protein n=1 Tax=Geminisphaera colitermitum TaxID=1148786 RepID=UPI0018E300ED|nr:hypothetical protein [Geminisphaera colitermitum]